MTGVATVRVERRRFRLEDTPTAWVWLAYLTSGVLLTSAHRLSADEGQVLTGAWNIFNESRIYDDFFEFIGPASFHWVELSFQAFGPRYLSALIASWCLLLAGLWAFTLCVQLVSNDRAAAIATSGAWLFFATTPPFINHNTYSSYLGVVYTYLMLRYLRHGRGRTALLAGVVASLTVFFLQPKGLVLLAVGIGSIAWRSRNTRLAEGAGSPSKGLLAFGVGATLVLAIGFTSWGFAPFASLITVAAGNVTMNHQTLSYAPLLLCLGMLLLVGLASNHIDRLDRDIGFLLVTQLGLWLSTIHLPDLWHLLINAWPLLIVFAALADYWIPSASARTRRLLSYLLVALAIGVFAQALSRNVSNTRAARAWTSEMRRVLGGQPFFAFTFLPSFYLELGERNPYYNSVLYVSSHPTDHFQRNVRLLETHAPPFVILDYSTVEKYGHDLDNAVDDYIRAQYRRGLVIPHSTGGLEIWERQ